MSKILKEVLKMLVSKPFTEDYPATPSHAPEGFRGKPVFNEKCIGCGACAAACPPQAIDVIDNEDSRVVRVWYAKCMFCARCQEVCPEGAINLTEEFELSTYDTSQAVVTIELPLRRCEICGKPVGTLPQLEKIEENMKGLDLTPEDLKTSFYLCPECKAKKEAVIYATKVLNG